MVADGKNTRFFRKLRHEGFNQLTSCFVMMRALAREDFSPLIPPVSPSICIISPWSCFGESQAVTGETLSRQSRKQPGLESCFGLIGRNADLR